MKKHNEFTSDVSEMDTLLRKYEYITKRNEENIGKILHLDLQSIGMRHELELKRRGFSLIAGLANTMAESGDDETVFVDAAHRINATLNMQKTVVLFPAALPGTFQPTIMRGYSEKEQIALGKKLIRIDKELLRQGAGFVVNGEDSPHKLATLREKLGLPFLVAAPIILHNSVVGLLVTGRLVEQPPFLTRLGSGDLETIRTISAFLASLMASRQLKEIQKYNNIMLDATPLCCCLIDENYDVISCNQATVTLFNLADKQEYINSVDSLSPPFQEGGKTSLELKREKIREAFDSGYLRFEWTHCTPTGTLIPSEITLVRVSYGGKNILAAYTRDLREQKAILAERQKVEDQLRLARDIAEQNAKAKSNFLANMSHEIRTPMNAIVGMAHLLKNTKLDVRQREYLDKSQHSARLLLRIINDILDFSKIEASKITLERIPFSPRQLAQNVQAIIRPLAEEKNIELAICVEDQVPQFVMGDPLRTEQVLLNMANNAVKFTEKGSVAIHVNVSKTSDSPLLIFSVKDTGIGITKEQQESLFKPFSQADTSTTRKFGGTGLGLAISQGFVRLMGGDITCQSSPGMGSTFSFYFPLKMPGVLNAIPATFSAPIGDVDTILKGANILLAEDNEINRMIAIELLNNKGITTYPVKNGREAIEALQKEHFDLVLMDIQMPEMDGITATRNIRAMPQFEQLPIIAMTAHALEGDQEVSLENGMNAHITKPIEPDTLYSVIAQWLKK